MLYFVVTDDAILSVCCSVWGCCSATEIQHLQRLQNRAARIVTNSAYEAPIRPILEKLEW